MFFAIAASNNILGGIKVKNSMNDIPRRDERAQSTVDAQAGGNHGISSRAVIVSLIFVVLMSYISAAGIVTGVLPNPISNISQPLHSGTIGPLLVMMFVVNPLVLLFLKRKWFNETDLKVLFVVLMGATPIIPTIPYFFFNLMGIKVAQLTKPSAYRGFVDSMSSLVLPKSNEALRGFLMGSSPVPWSEWVGPIILWMVFLVMLYILMLGTANLIRRRWEDIDHLRYPLLVPMAEIIHVEKERENSGALFGSLWSNPFMWVGFAIAFVWSMLSFLHKQFPGIPFINSPETIFGVIARRILEPYPLVYTAFYFPALNTGIIPYMVGIGFLVNLNLLFNVWFFYLLPRLVNVIFIHTGFWDPGGVSVTYLWHQAATGAILALSLYYIWLMRYELVSVFRSAFGGHRPEGHEDEVMSPRVSLFCVGFSLVFLIVFSVFFLKISILWALVYFIVYALVLIGTSRLRAEAGSVYPQHAGTHFPLFTFMPIFGAKGMGWQNIFSFNFFFSATTRGPIAGGVNNFLEGYSLAKGSGINRKTLTFLIMFCFLLGGVISMCVTLVNTYEIGANNSPISVHTNFGRSDVDRAFDGLPDPVIYHSIFVVAGAVVVGIFAVLRSSFMWFPFHPLGFAWGINDYASWMVAGSFFIAWLIKFPVMRYGGMPLYRKLVPMFIGVIIGDLTVGVVTVVWRLIAILMGG